MLEHRQNFRFWDVSRSRLSVLFSLALGGLFTTEPASSRCGSAAEREEDPTNYQPVVQISKVEVASEKKDPLRRNFEVHFDIHPNLPSGSKILFELEYLDTPLDSASFTMKGSQRKSQTLIISPKMKLPASDYFLWVSVPLENQSAEVKKAFEKVQKDFPEVDAPWRWYFKDLVIAVGGEADSEFEKQYLKKLCSNWCDKLIESNNIFVDTCDEVIEGKKFASKAKLDRPAFIKWLVSWMEQHGALQKDLATYPDREQAMWRKHMKLWVDTHELSQMVAKRALREKLKLVGERYEFAVEDLKLPKIEDFDPNYPQRASEFALRVRYQNIARNAGFGEEAGGEADAGASEAGSAGVEEGADKESDAESEAGGGEKPQPPEAKEPDKKAGTPEKKEKKKNQNHTDRAPGE